MNNLEQQKNIEKAKSIEDLGSLDDQFEDLIHAANHAEATRQRFALCVDATSSMGPFWNLAKDALQQAVDEIKTRSNVPIQICVVGYRDHEFDPTVVEKSNWSDDTQYLKDYIVHMRCRGGGDYPESVGHALKDLMQEGVNQIILIADAPGKDSSTGYPEAASFGREQCPIFALYLKDETRLIENFRKIAHLSGGKAFHLKNTTDLGDIFQVLLAKNKALQIDFQPTSIEGKRLAMELRS